MRHAGFSLIELMVTVAIGSMKWDVPIAELVPQLVRTPEAAKAPKPARRIDEFEG